ncbi:S8 family serine peptidase [Actinokineospora guangxiensis]|uniref:S8 family serine peptidase n=1 Tax=Actinokineospora guangxiensis TaxID=1490288 RepID=A0ABW0EPZ4_9PSEU
MGIRRRTRLGIGAGVIAVVAATVAPAGASGEHTAADRPRGTAVTLLTGDVVTVAGARAHVRPGPGREGVRFLQRLDEEGDVHVVPSDVAVDVAAGRVDGRLFDIGGLVRAGLDDARSPSTPLIVTHDGPSIAGAADELALPSIGGVALKADKGTPLLANARTAGVGRIWLDGPVRATLDKSVPQVGAPAAWAAGHTGAGATVAVLDTGIDETHPDLAGAVVGARDFSDSDSTDDRFGHGTHVAATVTGDGQYKGVAPDAKLLNGKVLDDFGGGSESGIIAGMEWAAAEGADVINMSLGSPFPSDGTDPMSLAVNRITADTGALFVISAGNSGPSEGSIGSPAAADAALTVGAVDRADAIADFSSRGPRTGDNGIKPEITAPGVDIVAAKAAQGVIGDPVGDKHVALSGTSMSAPHVAGAAAILAAQHPDWTPEQVKSALVGTAKPTAGLSVYEQGAGRVDVAKASAQTLTSSPATLGLGVARWPHHDDEPITSKLTYRNSGAEPLTLRVAADLRGPGGAPAPAGMLAVSPAEVTVPAGGQAEVTVTAVTSLNTPDGRYGGTVTATGGATVLRTPLGVTKEVESYDVTLDFINHDGEPTADYGFRFVDTANPKAYWGYDESGSLTTRLPKGVFYLDAYVQKIVSEDSFLMAMFYEPAFRVDGDTRVVIDARETNPVAITVDQPGARPNYAYSLFSLDTEWGDTGNGVFANDFEGMSFAESATSAPGKATFELQTRMAEPSGEREFIGSPYQYSVGWKVHGGVPASLAKRFRDRDLVKVTTGANGPGTGFFDGMTGGPLPRTFAAYYSKDIEWASSFDQMDSPSAFPPEAIQYTAMAGEVTKPGAKRWNVAVFGPAFPTSYRVDDFAGRTGDDLYVNVPMFTDQGPGHVGFSRIDTARTTLHRGERLIGETEYDGYVNGVDPGGSGVYRLHTEATRSSSPLSTRITADWTFRSASDEDTKALPMMAVRFAPKLDESNKAAAGRLFTVPVYVQHNSGGKVRTPSVRVSYDDGATWKPTALVKVGERWHAVLAHPKKAKFVSFKASAKDAQGNAVEQTIIRAYALK